MALQQRVATHLRWRRQQARRLWRGRLFDVAGRYRLVVKTHDHHGNTFFVSADDPGIGRSVFVHGQFDATKTSHILGLLHVQGISITHVLDIGANIGTTTIEMLTLLPEAHAECFEPEPFNHALLKRNIHANGLAERVRVHQIALSDTDGSLVFELSAKNPGDHRVRATDADGAFDEASRQTITIPACRLDSMGFTLDAQTLTCIDVQAHELQVLLGAPELVGPVSIELWPYGLERAGTLDALIGHLDNMGGQLLDVSESPRVVSARQIAEMALDRDPHHVIDLLILPA